MENCSGSCETKATKVAEGINRRALLTGLAAALVSVGLTSTGEAALAAAKTYTIGKTSEIPVKGGKMYYVANYPVFITQPKAGVFKAFNGYCTHVPTSVAGVIGSNIICTEHGSTFDSTTGAVTKGPARRPLAKINLTVSGNVLKVKL